MEVNHFVGFRYIFSQAAQRDMKKIDKQIVSKVMNKLDELVTGKDGLDIKRMQGFNSLRYRLRIGDFRVVFEEYKKEIVIIVVGVGHRKEIYKKMR